MKLMKSDKPTVWYLAEIERLKDIKEKAKHCIYYARRMYLVDDETDNVWRILEETIEKYDKEIK